MPWSFTAEAGACGVDAPQAFALFLMVQIRFDAPFCGHPQRDKREQIDAPALVMRAVVQPDPQRVGVDDQAAAHGCKYVVNTSKTVVESSSDKPKNGRAGMVDLMKPLLSPPNCCMAA